MDYWFKYIDFLYTMKGLLKIQSILINFCGGWKTLAKGYRLQATGKVTTHPSIPTLTLPAACSLNPAT